MLQFLRVILIVSIAAGSSWLPTHLRVVDLQFAVSLDKGGQLCHDLLVVQGTFEVCEMVSNVCMASYFKIVRDINHKFAPGKGNSINVSINKKTTQHPTLPEVTIDLWSLVIANIFSSSTCCCWMKLVYV